MKYLLPVLLAALVAGCDPQARQPGDTGAEDKGKTAAEGLPRSEPPRVESPYLTPTAAAFSADGKRLLVGYDGWGGITQPERWDCLDLWDTATGQQLQTFTGHKQKVNFVAFLPDGKRAISASQDETLRLWDTKTGRQLASAALPGGLRAAALTPDGKSVLIGDSTDEIKVLDVDGFRQRLSLKARKDSVISFCVSGDSRWALSGHARTDDGRAAVAILWDLKTGDKVRLFTSADGWVRPGVMSPDGATAFLTRWAGKLGVNRHEEVVLADLKTGKALRVLPQEWGEPLAFLPGEKRILCRRDHFTIKLCDLTTNKEVWSVEVEEGNKAITVRTVSPHGKLVFTAGGSYTVGDGSRASMKLWDAAKGELLQQLDREWPPR